MTAQTKIVIIGGTACGPKTAARARRRDQKCDITLIEQGGNFSTATCGFPYFVSKVIADKASLIARPPEYFKHMLNINAMTGTRATAIDRANHRVDITDIATGESSSLDYDKLVLATGSTPFVPDLAGKELNGVFTMNKMEDAFGIYDYLQAGKAKKVVVVGAGLIGMEMAEAFIEQGLEVTVVEALDWVLPALMDFEIASYIGRHMEEKGVKLVFGQRVTGFEGDGKGNVKKVIAGNTGIEADMVLMALGNRPNTVLATYAGLDIGVTGGIAVNAYLQTSDPDIYAGGDCAENENRITGQKTLSLMGSTANKHGRVIGTNLTGGTEEFHGVVGTAILKIFDYNAGRTGLNEAEALKAGYDVVTSLIPGHEHANFYPEPKEILVKLVVDKASNKILGGQVVGPGDAAKRVDVLATAVTFGAGAEDLAGLDLAYAPPYNNAIDPLHHAANVILNKQTGIAKAISPTEVYRKIKRGEDVVLLDVRNPDEWEEGIIDAEKVMMIPLGMLRGRTDELPRDKEIIIYCRTSIRAYQAQRILEDAGFGNTVFLDGSIRAWPYSLTPPPKK